MPINSRHALASLLLVAVPFACSKDETPQASTPVAMPGPLQPIPAEAVPPRVEMPAPDPAVVPASTNSPGGDAVVREISGEVRNQAEQAVRDVRGTVDQASGEVRNQADQVVRDVRGTVDQATGEVRGVVDRVRQGAEKSVEDAGKDARVRARAIEGEVRKDAREIKKQVIEGLLGDPRN